VKPSRTLQLAAQSGFVVLSAVVVFHFVGMLGRSEATRQCAALCTLKPDYAAVERRAPDFELPTLDGQRVRLSDFRGQTVVVNFWTRNCQPCLEEMPSLADFARKLKARDKLVFLTVNTDDTPEEARAALASVLPGPAPFPVLLDPDAQVVTGKFGTKLYPETWYIDPNGVIRARFDGPRDWSQMVAVNLAEDLLAPRQCAVRFTRRQPSAGEAWMCQGLAD
jgi:peroxiredoxin